MEQQENAEWHYKEAGIKIPEGSRTIERWATKTGGLQLTEIPPDLIRLSDESYKDFFEYSGVQDPRLYVIANSDGIIRLGLICDGEVSSKEEIRLRIQELTQRRLRDRWDIRIPAIYDKSAQWLIFPIDSSVHAELDSAEKSSGPSGTHYSVYRMNVLVDALCGGSKIEDIIYDDRLQNCEFMDIRRLNTGEVYLTASSKRLLQEIDAAVQELSIITSDRLAAFQGPGGLADTVRTLRNDPSLKLDVIDREITESLQASEVFHREGMTLRVTTRGLPDREFLDLLHAAYTHVSGYPIAVALTLEEKPHASMKDGYKITVAQNHPDAVQHRWISNSDQVLACFDGSIHLQPPHGDVSLNWEIRLHDITPIPGQNEVTPEQRSIAIDVINRLVQGTSQNASVIGSEKLTVTSFLNI